MFQLDKTPHPAEQHFLEAVQEGGGNVSVVKEARAAGLPWNVIWQLVVQYGPQAWAIIQAIVKGIKTPTPA